MAKRGRGNILPFFARRQSRPGLPRLVTTWIAPAFLLGFAVVLFFGGNAVSISGFEFSGKPSEGPQLIRGTASVIDGDTIEIHDTRIRFHGIDAPESSQLCRDADGKPYRAGQKAGLALSDEIGGPDR